MTVAAAAMKMAAAVRARRGRTTVRVLVWVGLCAVTLREIGGTVGVWTGGSLDTGSTVLIAVVAPAWLFVFAPSWLGWRILCPLRLRRAVVAACWLSPLVRTRDLDSIDVFLRAARAGRDSGGGRRGAPRAPARARLTPADAWTALAAALQAERQQSFQRAARITDALAYLPEGSRIPWLARVHGVEALVGSAIARGDLAAARGYLRLGRGRLIAFWDAVARDEAGETVRAAELWSRWALAPRRLLNLPLLQRALARGAAAPAIVRAPTTPVAAPAPDRASGDDQGEGNGNGNGARLRHLFLLAAAARGTPVSVRELMVLAAAWQAELDGPSLARLHARALEIDARDAGAAARALRESVIDELAAIAETATGDLSSAAPAPAAGSLAAALGDRIRDRLYRRVEAALAPIDTRRRPPGAPPVPPLEAWERWLDLCAALERVERHAGRMALTALWHSGVRNAVWNWTCALCDAHQAHAAWVAHIMFAWVADRAELAGDLSATLTNRENARAALNLAS